NGDIDDHVLALAHAAAGVAGTGAAEGIPLRAAGGAAPGCPAGLAAKAAHEFLENIFGGKAAGAGPRPRPGARAAESATKSGKARIALSVDFAAVELAALFGIVEQIISVSSLGELTVRRGIIGVLVGVVL